MSLKKPDDADPNATIQIDPREAFDLDLSAADAASAPGADAEGSPGRMRPTPPPLPPTVPPAGIDPSMVTRAPLVSMAPRPVNSIGPPMAPSFAPRGAPRSRRSLLVVAGLVLVLGALGGTTVGMSVLRRPQVAAPPPAARPPSATGSTAPAVFMLSNVDLIESVDAGSD